jgi:hypothetical protein
MLPFFPLSSLGMNPSFGVPWPRLQRAAARLSELHDVRAEAGRVSALLFLCGVKYLLTYREANGRRLSHYIDDGLREAVAQTLPTLMKCCEEFAVPKTIGQRKAPAGEHHPEFQQLTLAFCELHKKLPASTVHWLGDSEVNVVRLTFGMGVAARFAPESHEFVRRFLARPLILPITILDVLDSFRWHPAWSVSLAA